MCTKFHACIIKGAKLSEYFTYLPDYKADIVTEYLKAEAVTILSHQTGFFLFPKLQFHLYEMIFIITPLDLEK